MSFAQAPQVPEGFPSGAAAKPQRAWFRKKRFIIPIALVVLFTFIGALGGGDAESAPGTADKEPAATATKAPTKAEVAAAAAKAKTDAAAKVEADRVAAEAKAVEVEVARVAAEAKAVEDAAAAAEVVRVAAEAAAAEEAARGTVSQQNASSKAGDYLDMTPFSRSGLIEQLEYEGFSTDDATWGVDRLAADWNVQAAGKAKKYLGMTAFSRSGLIDQLTYEGFSAEQAEYGVGQTGL